MKTMYGRQFAAMTSMVLLSFLLLGASFATLSYQYTIQEQEETLARNADSIASFTTGYLDLYRDGTVWQRWEFQSYLKTVAQVGGFHILLCDNSGLVLYATSGDAELAGLEGGVLSDGMVSQISAGMYAGASTLGPLYPERRYVVGLPILNSNGLLQGLVLVTSDASGFRGMWKDLTILFLVTAAAVVIIAAIICSVTSMHQSKPLKEIAAAARQFGMGQFTVRVDLGGRKDEVGELAEAFNSMADSLARSEQQRSEFIANVSHELKTPMTTIAGFADGILDGTIPPEKERHYLQIISSETQRLSRLVRSMLDLSRLQSDTSRAAQQQFDIAETMVRTLVSLEDKVNNAHLDVSMDLPENPVPVWGDQDAITQVCYNLLDNAIKFSSSGGTLGISVSEKGPKAVISVSNQGETIPPEELSMIFDRFHKTDHSRSEDRDGVGLGLYIVKTILNSHKENITCTSENGVTRFTFTLSRA